MVKDYLMDSEFSDRPLIIDIQGNNRFPGVESDIYISNQLKKCLKITEPGIREFIDF